MGPAGGRRQLRRCPFFLTPSSAAPGAQGKAPTRAKLRGDQRNKWTEEKKGELVKLVDDEAYRTQQMGGWEGGGQ